LACDNLFQLWRNGQEVLLSKDDLIFVKQIYPAFFDFFKFY